MILVFGGAYQGKKDFVIKELGIKEEEILDISEIAKDIPDKNEHDLVYSLEAFLAESIKTAKCVYGFDSFVRVMTVGGRSIEKWIEENGANLKDCVIVMQDVSQGLVPMDYQEREFREENGRAMVKLAEIAEKVYRVFCGIGNMVKS